MIKELKKQIKEQAPCRPETVLLAAVLLLNAFFGNYVELVGCVSTALLSAAVLFSLRGNPRPAYYKTLWALGFAAVCVGYLFTVLYAVDRGYAFLGFVKFLPLGLAAFLCMQLTPAQRSLLLHAAPAVGLVQLLFAAPAYLVPAFKAYFITYGRFHGGFGYSNVYALFALCGMVIVLMSELPMKLPVRLGAAVALLGGVLLSGSRTTFLLAVPAILFVVVREKRLRLPLGISAAAVIAAAAVYGIVSGNIGNVARFLNFSISESSYIDRLLYYYDALPLILSHPFGLGYKGYTFIVPSVQTGLYSVTFVHNEYLQFLLDVGVVPGVLFFAGLVSTFWGNVPMRNKVVLAVILLHAAVDFDLQFLSVLLLLPLLTAYPEKQKKQLGPRNKKAPARARSAIAAAAAVFVLAGAYLGVATGFEAFKDYGAAAKLYPGLTMSKVVLLRQAASDEERLSDAAAYAERIIKQNRYIAIAYDVSARAAAADGDYDTAVEQKNKAIDCAPYTKSEYLDMFSVLYEAIQSADRSKNQTRLRRYCNAMVALPERMNEALSNMSALGRKITDQPDLSLPDEYMSYIKQIYQALEE